MKNPLSYGLVKSFIYALFMAFIPMSPAAFAEDVVVVYQKSTELDARPYSNFFAQEGHAIRIRIINDIREFNLLRDRLQPGDRVIGLVIKAHGEPTAIDIEKGHDGRSFAYVLQSGLAQLQDALGNAFFIHLQSCSLSRPCTTGKNFVEQFAPAMIQFARAQDREVLITSFDFATTTASLAGESQWLELTQSFRRESVSSQIVTAPVMALFRLIVWASNKETYTRVNQQPITRFLSRVSRHLGDSWIRALGTSLAAYAFADYMDGPATLSAATTLLSLRLSALTRYSHARLTTGTSSGDIRSETGHNEELLSKVLVHVIAEPPAARPPQSNESLADLECEYNLMGY